MIDRQQRISEFVTSTNRAKRRSIELARTDWRPDPTLRDRMLHAQFTQELGTEHNQDIEGVGVHLNQQNIPQEFHRDVARSDDIVQSNNPEPSSRNRWRLGPQFALIFAAIMIFALGVFASINTLQTNKKVEAQVKQASNATKNNSTNSDTPDERELDPSAVSTYKTDPVLPRTISIDKIGVKARIKPVGTKNNNELIAPSGIYDVGWFEQSSKPGGNGAMLLDGHVHGPTKKGVFYNLKKLVAGDTIQVERGDGTTFTYKVVKTEKFNKDSVDMASSVRPIEPGKPGLNLITCTGSLVKGENTYTERLIVYTSLAE